MEIYGTVPASLEGRPWQVVLAVRLQRSFPWPPSTATGALISKTMAASTEHYRADGVRIAHDPHAPGMAEKYGEKGATDDDGFDPYADSNSVYSACAGTLKARCASHAQVGAGIYGGNVKRSADGNIILGHQYQNHNPRPGPVYDGTGYSAMSRALRRGESALEELLQRDPSLVQEISTGGATPLHMCGMSQANQRHTAYLIGKGGRVNSVDTYGFQPLHRMASNNLAVGAQALLEAGADVNAVASSFTPLQIALQSRARDVVALLRQHGARS
eukprot:3217709-Prymnesium_polylepis.2